MGSLAGLSRLESYGWVSAWISPECRSLYSLLSGFIFFGLNLTKMSAELSNLESYGWFSAWISPECRLVLFFSAWIWPECHSLYSLVLFFFGLNLWISPVTSMMIADNRGGLDLEFRSIYIFRPQYPHSSEGSKLTQSWLRNLPSKQIFLHKKLNNKIACIVSIPMVWIIDKMLSSSTRLDNFTTKFLNTKLNFFTLRTLFN